MANRLPVEAQRTTLEAIWRKYRAQAATSRRLKKEQGQWRRVLLVATIVAMFATPFSKSLEKLHCELLAKCLVVVASLLFAAMAWVNKQVLGDDSQQPWVRARQTAEGIKSIAFLFLTGTSPFENPQSGDPALGRCDALAAKVGAADQVSDDEAKKDLPSVPLTAEKFIELRLDDQIRYYETAAKRERQADTRIRNWGWGISAAVTLFGALGAAIAQEWRDIWAPTLGAASAMLATQTTRARHRFLIETYTISAEKLRTEKAIWLSSKRAPADADRMVTSVESILASENAGWVQQMLLKPVVPDSTVNANPNKRDGG